MKRRGFALLAVLWIVASASALALAVGLGARERLRISANRAELVRAEWALEDCLARSTEAIERLIGIRGSPLTTGRTRPLDSLARLLPADAAVAGCPGSVRLEPVGRRLDLATVDGSTLRRLLAGLGVSGASSDSLVDAFLDWRDPDDVPRRSGCERQCARLEGLPDPRNAGLASVDELSFVRGFDDWSSKGSPYPPLDSLFTTEPGRLLVSWAYPPLLASVPASDQDRSNDVAPHRRAIPEAWLITITSPKDAGRDALPRLGARMVARVALRADHVYVERRRIGP